VPKPSSLALAGVLTESSEEATGHIRIQQSTQIATILKEKMKVFEKKVKSDGMQGIHRMLTSLPSTFQYPDDSIIDGCCVEVTVLL
jgi:hypothetical protein